MGVESFHGTKCPKNKKNDPKPGSRCTKLRGCNFRGVYDLDGEQFRGPRVKTPTEASDWVTEDRTRRKEGRSPTRTKATLGDLWTGWIVKVDTGTILDRTGRPYKPSAIRSYKSSWNRVKKHADRPLADVDTLWLTERLNEIRSRLSASSTRNTKTMFQAIFRDSAQVIPGGIKPDPTDGLPAYGDGPRMDDEGEPQRVSREQVKAWIDALPDSERCVWALYFYAGLRQGEARALRWKHVDWSGLTSVGREDDLEHPGSGLIRVRVNWDQAAGQVAVKSDGSRRNVPVVAPLAEILIEQAERTAHGQPPPESFVVGRTQDEPFNVKTQANRATKAWEKAKLRRLTAHEGRHGYAAIMLAAGVPMSDLSIFMGHEDIKLTVKTYGGLVQDAELRAIERFQKYFEPDWESPEPRALTKKENASLTKAQDLAAKQTKK